MDESFTIIIHRVHFYFIQILNTGPYFSVTLMQGDVPWDDKEFRLYFLCGTAFWAAVTYYFFFRDGGREVTWKDFVNGYLAKEVVCNYFNLMI